MEPSLAVKCDKLSLSMLADELYDALRGVARKSPDDELTTVATSPPDTPVARTQSFAGSSTTAEEYDNFQLYRESPRVSSSGTDDEITVEPPSSRCKIQPPTASLYDLLLKPRQFIESDPTIPAPEDHTGADVAAHPMLNS